MTKINIEIDLEELFTSKDKKDALASAVSRSLDGWGKEKEQVQRAIADAIVRTCDVKGLTEYIDAQLLNRIETDEALRAVVFKDYNITNKMGELVQKALAKHAEIIEKQVVQHMMSKDFSQKIAAKVERELQTRMTNVLDITIEPENHDEY